MASCLEGSYLQNEEYLAYIFRGLDTDHSGKISKAELKQIYIEAGINNLKNAEI